MPKIFDVDSSFFCRSDRSSRCDDRTRQFRFLQKVQKKDWFLRSRQIAFIICDYFRVTGAHDTVLDYADFFSINHRNDDVQEFDTRWDQIVLSMTRIPPDDVLESSYKLRIRESDQLKTALELFDMEIHQKISTPNYQRFKTMVKRSTDQKLRLRNFDARNERLVVVGAVVTSLRELSGVERGKRYLLPVERKRPVFEGRPLQFPA